MSALQDWSARDWAHDVTSYERHSKLQRTAEDTFVKEWCERRIQQLRERWPGKLEYDPHASERLAPRTQGVQTGRAA